MRKLASIQKIENITPITGADKIELAHVLGWQCVVKKGEFSPGDCCVYFEIDSFLPIREEFEFLRKSSYCSSEILGEGFRLKTRKFRGQISQGLVLPVSDFPELMANTPEDNSCLVPQVGQDVTDLLEVRKYEIPERATTGGTIIGKLPYDVPHTDETRVQAEPGLIQEFAEKKYYITTKMDGSPHSVSIDENGFHVTGHNYEYKDDGASSFYIFVKENRIEENMKEYMSRTGLKTLTIQGEFCAPGIQGNKLKLKKPKWYVFTIRENGERVGLYEMRSVCTELHLTHVPVEEIDKNLPEKYPDVGTLLERAEGKYPYGGWKEGIVVRPCEPCKSKITGEYLSIKVDNNKYLLKNE